MGNPAPAAGPSGAPDGTRPHRDRLDGHRSLRLRIRARPGSSLSAPCFEHGGALSRDHLPAFVGGSFCGPPPGPGNGNGPAGSCTGNETAPPCGPGMVAGRNYAYTLIGTCANDYIDGRWWANELPGGSTPVDVWVSVNGVRDQAGWMGPNGAVGFRPTTATSCT